MTTSKLFRNRFLFDPNDGGGSGAGDDGNQGADKKYTQEDVNRMMASQAKNITAKLEATFDAKLKQLNAGFETKKEELIQQGKDLAGETAAQEAERKLKAGQESLDRQKAELKKQQDEQAQQSALASTQSLLAEKGLPTDLGQYLADTDETVRANNVDVFADFFGKAVDEAADKKVAGNNTPKAGGQGGGGSEGSSVTKEDYGKMSLPERMKFAADYPDDYKALMAKK